MSLKAFAITEEMEGTGGIYFAKYSITAKKSFCAEFDLELGEISCRRAPWADQYADTKSVPKMVMLEHGWWFYCDYCECRITDDRATYRGDEVITLDPVEAGGGIFCTPSCRDNYYQERSERAIFSQWARDLFEGMLFRRFPGASVAQKTHVYATAIDGLWVIKQCVVHFTFPGSTIGPATFRVDGIGAAPTLHVCTGDIAAWEGFAASLKGCTS